MRSATLDLQTNGRGLTSDLWLDIDTSGIVDPLRGVFMFDDFYSSYLADASSGSGQIITGTADYTLTVATSGTAATDTTLGNGVLKVDPGATTAGQGCNIQGGPWLKPTAGQVIAFEGRLFLSTITTGPLFFFGMTDAATAIITGGATAVVNTTNVTDAVAVTTVVSNGGGTALYTYHDETGESAVQNATAIHTAVADTYFKIGARIIGTERVEWFLNGVQQTSFDYKAGAGSNGSIPSIPLRLSICHQADGTQPLAYFDWVAVGQSAL